MAFKALNTGRLNKEYDDLMEGYGEYGPKLAPFASLVDKRLKDPIFRKGSPKLERQDTTETKRVSPALMRQMSDLTFDDKLDSEVKDIMTTPSTPRFQEIARGSSTISTPQEMIEDSRRTAERQKAQSSEIRHSIAYQAAKRGNPNTAKKFLHGTKTERRHSFGGKTRKRRKRRKTKRRKSKKGGGFFRKSPEQKKRKILMRLLKGDKDKVSRCLELNNTGKACQLDKQNKPGQLTQSCTSYNGMVRG